jgi:hypothetical protein
VWVVLLLLLDDFGRVRKALAGNPTDMIVDKNSMTWKWAKEREYVTRDDTAEHHHHYR